jgi:hypothetical protein
MRHPRLVIMCGWIAATQLGCTSSPTAPSPQPQAAPSPFATVTGSYRLTIEVDAKCTAIPSPLRVRTFDVALEDKGWHFVQVRIVDDGFGFLGGELSPPGADARYRFEWNNFDIGGCDYPEPTGGVPLYLCGAGSVILSGSMLSGEIVGSAWVDGSPAAARCFDASHRVVLVRLAR